MESGDILGHEFMGEVVEVGPEVRNLKNWRPGRGAISYFLRQLFFVQAGLFSCVRTRIRTRGSRKKCGVIRRPACSGIRT